jgi:hypothetical protein
MSFRCVLTREKRAVMLQLVMRGKEQNEDEQRSARICHAAGASCVQDLALEARQMGLEGIDASLP